jgi:hypothetical protein
VEMKSIVPQRNSPPLTGNGACSIGASCSAWSTVAGLIPRSSR